MAALNQVDSRQFIKPTTGVYNLATNIEYPAAYLAQRGPLFVHMKRRTKSKQKRKRESTKEEKDDESEEKPVLFIHFNPYLLRFVP